ncbi:MAG: hypothetical protein ACXWP0_01225 [Ktedonobacterales bacterium]
MASKTRGGVRSSIAAPGGGMRKPVTAQSNEVISAWLNTQHNAISMDVRAGAAKDGSEDTVTIEYKPAQVASDLDGVFQRLFHGTFAELLAKLEK